MCFELPPGCRAAGHLLSNRILPGMGLDDGTLWRPGVGGALSYQRPSQQKLVLDQMVRNETHTLSKPQYTCKNIKLPFLVSFFSLLFSGLYLASIKHLKKTNKKRK